MANIIAVVWDFDKTLVNGYMEEPIFEHYGVDSSLIWREFMKTGGTFYAKVA